MDMCMVDKNGDFLEILSQDREPFEQEVKVPLNNYYEILSEGYPKAKYNFDIKTWVGVGEKKTLLLLMPSELAILKEELEKAREDNRMILKAVAELYEILLNEPTV